MRYGLSTWFCLTVACCCLGCTAASHPPEIPAKRIARGVPYLWPEEEAEVVPEPEVAAPPESQNVTLGISNGIIAIVNSKIITLKEFDFHFGQALRDKNVRLRGPELFEDILDSLIERLLLLELAAQKELEAEDDEVDLRMEKITESYPGGWEAYHRMLGDNRMSWDDVKDQIRNSILIEKLERQIFAGLISPPPQDVLKAYQRAKKDFASPEKRDISLILIKKSNYGKNEDQARKVAEKVLKRLDSHDFAEVAELYSEGHKAKEGGRYGWIERQGDLSEEISRVAFSLKAGEVSSVQELERSFCIVKCHEIKESEVPPFEKVQRQIARQIIVQMRIERRKKAIEKIRLGAYIRRLTPAEYLKYREAQ